MTAAPQLHDATTGRIIGPATRHQFNASLHTTFGEILIDDYGYVMPLSYHGQPGLRLVWVD